MAYSRDGSPHALNPGDKQFFSLPINKGVPVVDQDLNLLQWMLAYNIGTTFDLIVTHGWRTKGSFSNFASNRLDMASSRVIHNGFSFLVNDTVISGTNRINLSTTTGRPAGTTYDVVFLELWHEEVRETGTIYAHGNVLHYDPALYPNDIIDPAIGVLAASRLQFRYRIRVVGPVNGLDSRDDIMTSDPVTIQGKKSSPETPGDPNFNFTSTLTQSSDPLDNYYVNITTDFTGLGEYGDINVGEVTAFPIALVRRTVGNDTPLEVTDLRNSIKHEFSDFVNPIPPESIVHSLDDHSDVSLTSPVSGQLLRFDGSNWTDHTLVLNDISNVAVGSPNTNDALVFNGVNWVPGSSTLDGLSDVTITSPATNSILRWNGSKWVDDDISIVAAASLQLSDLSNVSLAGVSATNHLEFNGTNWVPVAKPVVSVGVSTGISNIGTSLNPVISNAGVLSVTAGTGIVVLPGGGGLQTPIIVNNGVRTISAGTGISISGAATNPTITSTVTSGEANTGANVGAGSGLVFRDKTGSQLNFRTLFAGTNISISNNANDITISSSGGSLWTGSSIGATIPNTGALVTVSSMSTSTTAGRPVLLHVDVSINMGSDAGNLTDGFIRIKRGGTVIRSLAVGQEQNEVLTYGFGVTDNSPGSNQAYSIEMKNVGASNASTIFVHFWAIQF